MRIQRRLAKSADYNEPASTAENRANLKSFSEICSLRTARVRVMYCATLPLVFFFFSLTISIQKNNLLRIVVQQQVRTIKSDGGKKINRDLNLDTRQSADTHVLERFVQFSSYLFATIAKTRLEPGKTATYCNMHEATPIRHWANACIRSATISQAISHDEENNR